MEGVSRCLGVGPTVTLNGHTLLVKGRTIRHYGLIEAEIMKQRGNPLKMFRDAKAEISDDPVILKALATAAFEQAQQWAFVSRWQLYEFLGTWSGFFFALWLAVRDNGPEWTPERVAEVAGDEIEAAMRACPQADQRMLAGEKRRREIEDLVLQAGGEDDLGNSVGRP